MCTIVFYKILILGYHVLIVVFSNLSEKSSLWVLLCMRSYARYYNKDSSLFSLKAIIVPSYLNSQSWLLSQDVYSRSWGVLSYNIWIHMLYLLSLQSFTRTLCFSRAAGTHAFCIQIVNWIFAGKNEKGVVDIKLLKMTTAEMSRENILQYLTEVLLWGHVQFV